MEIWERRLLYGAWWAGKDDFNALQWHQLKCLQSHYPSLSFFQDWAERSGKTNQPTWSLFPEAGNHRRPGHGRYIINIGRMAKLIDKCSMATSTGKWFASRMSLFYPEYLVPLIRPSPSPSDQPLNNQHQTNISITWELGKILGLHSRPSGSKMLGVGPSNLCFSKPSRWFWSTKAVERHWSRYSYHFTEHQLKKTSPDDAKVAAHTGPDCMPDIVSHMNYLVFCPFYRWGN